MSPTTILAEKPSQAKAYALAIGNCKRKEGYFEVEKNDLFPDGAYITWAYGHLVQLVEPSHYKPEWKKWSLNNLPVNPDVFMYNVSIKGKNQYEIIKRLFSICSTICIAVDIDREGENIAWSIIKEAKAENKTIKRLWINSLEKEAILDGFNNLKNGLDYYQSYIEASTRQISDWLIGINMSRLFTLYLQSKGINDSFSVGRVQSPTLFMVYQRENEMNEFVAKSFYELIAYVNHPSGKFEVKAEGKFKQLEDAEKLLLQHQLELKKTELGEITTVTETNENEYSPRLYTLSSLQVKANKAWKHSPSQVLKIVQSLYEKKLVTYPRTGTHFITVNEFKYLLEKVEGYQTLLNVTFPIINREPNKRYVNSEAVQEHFAIIPTKQIPTEKTLLELSQDERNVYLEVVKNTVAMFHEPYKYKKTLIEIDHNGLLFKTTGNVEISKGWKALYHDSKAEVKDSVISLPKVSEGDPIQYVADYKEGKTSKPKRLTEGDLIPLMKNSGKVLEDSEEQIILKETEGIGTEATRANIIETLKEQKYIEIKKNLVYITSKGGILCQALEGTLLSSPGLTAQWETFLRLIGEGKREQKTFINGIYTFIDKMLVEIPQKMQSESFVKSVENIEKEKYIGKCPTCSEGHIVAKESFYVCTRKKDGCKQTFPTKLLKKSISEVQLVKLLTKGKTDKIKGFKGKRDFDAYLTLEQDTDKQLKKLKFNF